MLPYSICTCKDDIHTPCPRAEQWFEVGDIQLLSLHTGCQRTCVSLERCNEHKTDTTAGGRWKQERNCQEKRRGNLEHIPTITVVTVSWGKFDSHNLLKVMSHAQSPKRWSEVNFIGLSLWTIRVIRYFISSSDVFYHPCSKTQKLSDLCTSLVRSTSKVTEQNQLHHFHDVSFPLWSVCTAVEKLSRSNQSV